MAGFFNRIFGKRAQPARREPDADDNRIAVALLAMLTKQFDLIGMELGTVPATRPHASPECRGALLGLCIGILQAEGIEMTRDRCIDTFIAAFVLVYGYRQAGSWLLRLSRNRHPMIHRSTAPASSRLPMQRAFMKAVR